MLTLTVRLVDQTVDAVVGRLVTVGLTERPVVRRRPAAAGRRGLHHAERGVRTHVVVDAFARRALIRSLHRGVPFPQRGRPVLNLLVHHLVTTSLPFGRAVDARSAAAVPRVLRAILFPATNPKKSYL